MPTANGPLRGKLYVPIGVKHPQGMVVAHGMHRLGIDEPRLISFARGTAEAGLAVFTPEISALADYHVDEKSVTTVCEAPAWLQRRIGGAPVIVTTLSFSGGLALVAARNPGCASHIRTLVLFGAYDDLARVSRYLVTGRAEYPDGHVVALPAHPYGPQVFLYAHLSRFFPQDDLPAAHEALRYWLWEEPENAKPWLAKLSPAARSTMEDLFANHLETLRPKMLDVIRTEQPELAVLSPHGQIRDLRVPVLILHGSADNVIPAAESAWLAGEIPPKELREVDYAYFFARRPTTKSDMARRNALGALRRWHSPGWRTHLNNPRSITPACQIRARRRCLCDAIQDFWQVHRVVMQARKIIWKGGVSVPAVLRAISVFHFAVIRWIRGALQKGLHQINCVIQEVGIRATAINV